MIMMVMVMMLMTFMMPVEDDSEGDYNDDDINYSVKHCLYLGNIGRVLDGEIVNDDENLTIIMVVGLMHDCTDENEDLGVWQNLRRRCNSFRTTMITVHPCQGCGQCLYVC